jgi:hypothetical protein
MAKVEIENGKPTTGAKLQRVEVAEKKAGGPPDVERAEMAPSGMRKVTSGGSWKLPAYTTKHTNPVGRPKNPRG